MRITEAMKRLQTLLLDFGDLELKYGVVIDEDTLETVIDERTCEIVLLDSEDGYLAGLVPLRKPKLKIVK